MGFSLFPHILWQIGKQVNLKWVIVLDFVQDLSDHQLDLHCDFHPKSYFISKANVIQVNLTL